MRRILTASVMALACAGPGVSADFSEAELRELVLDTIRANPEIVMEAIETLQARDEEAKAASAAAALVQNRELLQNDPNAPVIGNPDGDVTIVEFFDYNCGYCRRVFASVTDLLESDGNIRVIMREWPILGEESVFAARASLAAREQGKYEEFHNALMGSAGRADEATVIQVARSVGLDIEQLRKDMEAPEIAEHFQASQELTQSLGVNGTPAFVFGETLIPGAIDIEQMRSLVEELREG